MRSLTLSGSQHNVLVVIAKRIYHNMAWKVKLEIMTDKPTDGHEGSFSFPIRDCENANRDIISYA